MPITTTHYPSNFYDSPLTASYNNDVTRRLAVRDYVGFGPSPRFGGQQYEQKAVPGPYEGTIMESVAACQQLINEMNLSSFFLPEMGFPVILGTVGASTSILQTGGGVGVTYLGGVTTSLVGAGALLFDGVSVSTGLRVLYFNMSNSAFNGVYQANFGTNINSPTTPVFYMTRATDLTNWWQFVKPKVFLSLQGTVNKANVYALQTDGFEQGNTFNIAQGSTLGQLGGTSITFAQVNYSIGIASTTTSFIYPPYTNPLVNQDTGEYDFLSNAESTQFIYLKNRAHRLAYRLYKMRENFQPSVSSYGNNIVLPIGLANTLNNIGYSTFNNLPAGSRYPASWNRGW